MRQIAVRRYNHCVVFLAIFSAAIILAAEVLTNFGKFSTTDFSRDIKITNFHRLLARASASKTGPLSPPGSTENRLTVPLPRVTNRNSQISLLFSTKWNANIYKVVSEFGTDNEDNASVSYSRTLSRRSHKPKLMSVKRITNNSRLLAGSVTTNQGQDSTELPLYISQNSIVSTHSVRGFQQQSTNRYIKPVYLSVKFIGRLGNLMFEFASLIGTAQLHKVTPVIEPNDFLTNTFNINIPKMDSKVIAGFTHIGEKRPCAYDTLNGNFSTNITLHGYFQSWRYFKTAFSELRGHFAFRDKVKEHAVSSLLLSLGAQHGNISAENLTFVGIHVRRGDFLWEHKKKFGYVVASAEYLRAAMDLFVAKYGKVMFVVCSNDMNWTKSVIPHENATFIENQKAEVDMATLSLCNHTIMTSGSFGWWAGFLAGGSTVYQIEQVTPGSDLSKQFDLRDYMLPDWIGISKSGNISNVNL